MCACARVVLALSCDVAYTLILNNMNQSINSIKLYVKIINQVLWLYDAVEDIHQRARRTDGRGSLRRSASRTDGGFINLAVKYPEFICQIISNDPLLAK